MCRIRWFYHIALCIKYLRYFEIRVHNDQITENWACGGSVRATAGKHASIEPV